LPRFFKRRIETRIDPARIALEGRVAIPFAEARAAVVIGAVSDMGKLILPQDP
jgi:hypothetical protein